MSVSYCRQHYGVTIAGAAVMAMAFDYALLDYWHYFHMGSGGGPAMFMMLIGLPASLVLALGLGIALVQRARRRSILPSDGVLRGLGAVLVVFTLLFAAELWRTASARGPESGGTMAGYIADLIGR